MPMQYIAIDHGSGNDFFQVARFVIFSKYSSWEDLRCPLEPPTYRAMERNKGLASKIHIGVRNTSSLAKLRIEKILSFACSNLFSQNKNHEFKKIRIK